MSIPEIKYNDFMITKKIKRMGFSDYIEAIRVLVQHQDYKNIMNNNDLDGVSYLWKKQISNVNLSFDNGKYYYEFVLPRNGDIVDNIQVQSNVKHNVRYYLNNVSSFFTLSDNGANHTILQVNCGVPDYEFIMISAIYVEYKIRIIFETPPTLLTITARYYIMDIEHRILLQKSTVITDNYIYRNGICQNKS